MVNFGASSNTTFNASRFGYEKTLSYFTYNGAGDAKVSDWITIGY